MKSLLFILSLLFMAACNESEQVWDELTPYEQSLVRQRGRSQCLTENRDNYNKFKSESLKIFTSSAYARNKSFISTFKENGTVKKTTTLQVWKVDSAAGIIYFYVTEDLLGSSSYFLKLSVTQNDDLIEDLLVDHCDKVYTSSAGSTSVTVKYEYEPDSLNELTDNYTFNFAKVPYFSAFTLSRKHIKKKADGKTESTVNYTSTLVNDDLTDFVTTNFAATYVNGDGATVNRYSQNFCEVVYTTGTTYRLIQNGIGFKQTCTTTYPDTAGGWDL